MTILSKLFLTFDIFYVIIFFTGAYISNTYFDGDVEKFWKDETDHYKGFKDITVWGMGIFLLQFIYFGLTFIWLRHI